MLLALACVHLPTPEEPDWSWDLDRSTLPHGELRIAHLATVTSTAFLSNDSRWEPRTLPVSALVYLHPEHGPVLIDTGFGERTARDPRDYPGRFTSRMMGLQVQATLPELLPDLGYTATDVEHIVCTHLHYDHAGGVEDFPDATLWIGPEWDFGSELRRTKGVDPRPYADHADHREVTYDDGPYGPFDAHEDLFGDGSIVLLPTGGHTPGSTSVLVNLPGGSFLYTGDAAWVDRNWQEPVPKGKLARDLVETDWMQGMDALWRYKWWDARYPDQITIIAGHEPENVQRLKAWPDAYR